MTDYKPGPVKGWKCFDVDLKCKGHQFEVGKSYEIDGEIIMCQRGFHFHEKSEHLFNYYDNNAGQTRVCEVIAHYVITGDDKSVCSRIEIVKELSFFEICNLIGYGHDYGDGYGNGDGNGDGYGNGYGDGYGNGYGYGDGYGHDYGDGYGNGYGYGYGNGDGYGNGKYQLPDFIKFEEEKIA